MILYFPAYRAMRNELFVVYKTSSSWFFCHDSLIGLRHLHNGHSIPKDFVRGTKTGVHLGLVYVPTLCGLLQGT